MAKEILLEYKINSKSKRSYFFNEPENELKELQSSNSNKMQSSKFEKIGCFFFPK